MKKILNITALILSVVLAAGVKLWFHACAAKEDGTWMHCHTAEKAVCISGAVLAVLLLAELYVKRGSVRCLLGVLCAACAAVTAFIPNTIVKMCMMTDMRCHSTMKPAVILLSLAIALCSVISGLLALKKAE